MKFFVRIQIRGSMPLTNGSGFGSCYFRHWTSRRQQKSNLFKKFFYLLLFEGAFTSFSKNKVKKKSQHRTVGIKIFLTIFAWWYKDLDLDPYLWLMDPDPDPGGPKTYGSNGSWSATLLFWLVIYIFFRVSSPWSSSVFTSDSLHTNYPRLQPSSGAADCSLPVPARLPPALLPVPRRQRSGKVVLVIYRSCYWIIIGCSDCSRSIHARVAPTIG